MDNRFDKLFNMMEKMYVEFSGKFDKMDDRINGIESKMATKEDIKEINRKLVVLENKLDNNCKALYDGYIMNSEKLTVVEMKVDGLASKVENQDLEIRVVKNVIKH